MGDRGASEVLSFALVFGLVVTSVAIISVSGVQSLQSARDAEQLNNAERAFDVLSDNVEDVARRGAPSRATEINLAGAQLVAQHNVTMKVTLVDDGGHDEVVERQIRPIVYEGNRERTVVYEAGATFRTTRSGGTVVAGPPLVLDSNRGFVQIVALQSRNRQSAGGTTVLVRTIERSTELAVADRSGSFDDLVVNVTSPRADLWATYFEERGFTSVAGGTNAAGDEFVTYERPAPDTVFVTVSEIDVEIDQ